MEPGQPRGDFGPWGGVWELPPCRRGRYVWEEPWPGFGSWNLAVGEGQVPAVPLSPAQAGGLQQSPAGVAVPCLLLTPAVAPKVSSVLEGSVLFLALNQGLSRQSQG